MNTDNPSTAQPDNLFGVCHTLGQTFGIAPIYLRIAVLVAMLVDFQLAAIAYALAGVAAAAPALIERTAARLHRARTAH